MKYFPYLHKITAVKSWFGLVNQISYAFPSAEWMQSFRNLLKPITANFHGLTWGNKNTIHEGNQTHGIKIIDKVWLTCLAIDFSKRRHLNISFSFALNQPKENSAFDYSSNGLQLGYFILFPFFNRIAFTIQHPN